MGIVFIPHIVGAVVVLVASYVTYVVVSFVLQKIMTRSHIEPALIQIIKNILKTVAIVLGIVRAASKLGFNVGAALARISVVGIAVGFAAQDSLSNIIAGFLIFFDKPFKVGDSYVNLNVRVWTANTALERMTFFRSDEVVKKFGSDAKK